MTDLNCPPRPVATGSFELIAEEQARPLIEWDGEPRAAMLRCNYFVQ